jgi:hypothetical protein
VRSKPYDARSSDTNKPAAHNNPIVVSSSAWVWAEGTMRERARAIVAICGLRDWETSS